MKPPFILSLMYFGDMSQWHSGSGGARRHAQSLASASQSWPRRRGAIMQLVTAQSMVCCVTAELWTWLILDSAVLLPCFLKFMTYSQESSFSESPRSPQSSSTTVLLMHRRTLSSSLMTLSPCPRASGRSTRLYRSSREQLQSPRLGPRRSPKPGRSLKEGEVVLRRQKL